MCRTSSIGAIVPPPVTTTFIRRSPGPASPSPGIPRPASLGPRIDPTHTGDLASHDHDAIAERSPAPASCSTRWPAGRSSTPTRTSTRIARPRGTSTRSWATTTIPNWPTPRGCPPTLVAPELDPATRVRQPGRATSTGSTTPSSIPGCWRSPGRSTASPTTGSPRDDRELYRPGRPRRRRGGLGPRGLEDDQPRGGLPDQRLRRPARGLGHDRDTCPACGPTTSSSSSTSRATVERLDGARTSTCRTSPPFGWRSAHRSSGSSSAGRGPARSACRRTSPRGRATPKRAVTPIRRALHGMDLRPDEHDEIRRTVFWTLAELCAESRTAVRPDDRPDPQRLPGGRRRGAATCSTAG